MVEIWWRNEKGEGCVGKELEEEKWRREGDDLGSTAKGIK
jgi:hypothetical protein